MRLFMTGANEWVGSAAVPELIAAGHRVVGLILSTQKAAALRAAGGEPLLDSVGDLATLKQGAPDADGVIHLAFGLDFSRIVEMAREEQQASAAFGGVYAGSGRTVVITSVKRGIHRRPKRRWLFAGARGKAVPVDCRQSS